MYIEACLNGFIKTFVINFSPPSPSLSVNSCHNKASFLLKFSGLTKVPTSKEDLLSPTSRPGWAQKSRKWQKVSTAVSTVGVLKQSVSTYRLLNNNITV